MSQLITTYHNRVEFKFKLLTSICYQLIQPIQIYKIANPQKQMKTQLQTQRFSPSHQQQQSPPTTMTEYLTIVRNFLLEMHQRVNQDFDYQTLPPNLISIIDRAAIKLKTNKQQLNILQKQNRHLQSNKTNITELNAQKSHLQKRFTQKNDQISILRQTVKTLYNDNQKLNQQKTKQNTELTKAKQTSSQYKKKLKRQQQEMNKHKIELQKLTQIAEQRLAQYANEDKQKQKHIRKLNQQLDKLKNQLQKTNKSIDQTKKFNQQLLKVKNQHISNLKVIDSLKYQNDMLKKQKNNLFESLQEKSKNFTQQLSGLRNQLTQQCQKTLALSISLKQHQMQKQTMLIKIKSYQEDIMIRTQKLKQKNDQIHKYDQEITKLVERIQYLSEISNEVMKENQMLSQKCEMLEEKLQQGRLVQEYVQRIKGELNYSKSMELGKLIEGLGNIRGII